MVPAEGLRAHRYRRRRCTTESPLWLTNFPGSVGLLEETLARQLNTVLEAVGTAESQALFSIPVDLADDHRVLEAVFAASIGLEYLPGGKIEKAHAGTLIFKNTENRVSSGVLYQPDVPDAHDEYVTRDDLLAAALDYSISADKVLHQQHDLTTDAGEVIAVIDWPFPVETHDRTLEPGTVFAVVRWSKDAWELIKSGAISGLSLGGTAIRQPAS